MATATSKPIERTTIGSTAGTSSNIHTIPITTITITITITTLTITIAIINLKIGIRSVIDKNTSATGAATLESEVKTITIIALMQTIQISIIQENNIPLK